MGNISWGRSQICMLLHYLLGLFIMGLTTWLVSEVLPFHELIRNTHWFVALLPAIVVCAVAIILCCRAGTKNPDRMVSVSAQRMLYRICYLLNAVASGLAVGVLTTEKGMLLTADFLLSLLPAIALGLLLFLLLLVPNRTWRKAVSIVFVVLSIALVIVSLRLWLHYSDAKGCTALFSVLFFLLFPVGMYYAVKDPGCWHKYLAYTGFGAFALILFVVIFILSEGEILDGLDFDIGGGGGSSKKKQSK